MKGIKKSNIIIIIFLLITVGYATANSFDVSLNICNTNWYCTNFTQDTCGTRTCTDLNACGFNEGKPAESIQCPPPSGSGGSSGGSATVIDYDFTLSSDLVKIQVNQDNVKQKIITINSKNDLGYQINMAYPKGYSGKTNFITLGKTTLSTQNGAGDFNIIIDSKNMSVGTYVSTITVANNGLSRNITLVVDVVDKNPKASINLEITTLPTDILLENVLNYTIHTGQKIIGAVSINTSILDPLGNTVYSVTNTVTDVNNYQNELQVDKEIGEGYYTLLVNIQDSNNYSYSRSKVFTILNSEKYYPTTEKPSVVGYGASLIWLALAIVLIILIVSNIYLYNVLYRKNDSEKGEPLGIGDENIMREIPRNIRIAKGLYDKGFIKKREYDKMLEISGYTIRNKDTETDVRKVEATIQKEVKKIEAAVEKEVKKAETVVETEAKKAETTVSNIESAVEHVFSKKINMDLRAQEGKAFVLRNGQKLYSIKELADYLNRMPDDVYKHHTNGRNDFANWIRDVFNEKDLAEDISKVKNIDELKKVLNE